MLIKSIAYSDIISVTVTLLSPILGSKPVILPTFWMISAEYASHTFHEIVEKLKESADMMAGQPRN